MILITGGSGFIGSNLIAGLSERHKVSLIVCDHVNCDQRRSIWQNIM